MLYIVPPRCCISLRFASVWVETQTQSFACAQLGAPSELLARGATEERYIRGIACGAASQHPQYPVTGAASQHPTLRVLLRSTLRDKEERYVPHTLLRSDTLKGVLSQSCVRHSDAPRSDILLVRNPLGGCSLVVCPHSSLSLCHLGHTPRSLLRSDTP